jgi:hypothetical protein
MVALAERPLTRVVFAGAAGFEGWPLAADLGVRPLARLLVEEAPFADVLLPRLRGAEDSVIGSMLTASLETAQRSWTWLTSEKAARPLLKELRRRGV